MAHADDAGDGSLPPQLADVIDSPQHAAAYCVLVDSLGEEGGTRSSAEYRLDISSTVVDEVYSEMKERGLVASEGEGRGTTYQVSPRAERLREAVGRYEGWTRELTPFWEEAYEQGVADTLRPFVDTPQKARAVEAIVTTVSNFDMGLAKIADIPDVSESTVRRWSRPLEDNGYIASSGAGVGTTYELTAAGRRDLLPVVAASGVDYTGLGFDQTDWEQAPPRDPDKWVRDTFGTPNQGGSCSGEFPDTGADVPLEGSLLPVLVHAQRTGGDIEAIAERYDAEVTEDELWEQIETTVLPELLVDANNAGSAIADVLNEMVPASPAEGEESAGRAGDVNGEGTTDQFLVDGVHIDENDVRYLHHLVAGFHRGESRQTIAEKMGVSKGTLKRRYDTFHQAGYIRQEGPHWDREYSVDYTALEEDGNLEEAVRGGVGGSHRGRVRYSI